MSYLGKKKGLNRPVLLSVLLLMILLYALFFSFYAIFSGHIERNIAGFSVSDELAQQLDSGGEARVMIMLKDSPSISRQDSVLSILGGEFKLEKRYSLINALSGTISNAGLERLRSSAEIKSIYPDRQFSITLSDSAFLIDANYSWNRQLDGTNITGKGETVCVIDTGIDYNHSALGGGLGNKVIGGYNFISDNEYFYDNNGHGTHVAGIIASDDAVYRGIAPDASLIAIKACDYSGSCRESDFAAGIEWCVANATKYNISVITLSIGGGAYNDSSQCDPYPAAQEISVARGRGMIVTVSSGNDNFQGALAYPACASNATSVGAVGKEDQIASYSNLAPILALLAPGGTSSSKIISTQRGGGFVGMAGTSMAAPHAAGAAALLHQYEKLYNIRNLSADAAESLLVKGGKIISSNSFSFPRIDLKSSMEKMFKINSSYNSIESEEVGVKFGNSTDFSKVHEAFDIGHDFISLDSGYPQFNKTANITFYSLAFLKSPIILKDGVFCYSCAVLGYDGNLSFSISGFSNYTAISNSRLETWDQTDSGKPYSGQFAQKGSRIMFYANYTNRTSDANISNGQCNLSFDDSAGIMAFNSTKNLFEYNRTFSSTGFKAYTISCNSTDFEPVSLSDSIEILTSDVNCTYPGANKDWNITNQSVTCVGETLWLNQSNLNILNGSFTLLYSNLILSVGNNKINVSYDSTFNSIGSRIESQSGNNFNLYVSGNASLKDSIFNFSRVYMLGIRQSTVTNTTFYDYTYFRGPSQNNVENSSFYGNAYFEQNSISTIANSRFNGTNVYFSDNSSANFTSPASNITSVMYFSGVLGVPKIYGDVNMPSSGAIQAGNITRYYPIRVVYSSNSSIGVPSKQVNITDKDGSVILSGLTDSDGWIYIPLTLNTTNYSPGNFTLHANSSSDISLFTSTPIVLNANDHASPSINSINATPNPVESESLISLSANVTDNVALDLVWVEISGQNHTMSYLGGIYIYNGFDTSGKIGFYNYTVYANDSSGNLALPVMSNFTVVDITPPQSVSGLMNQSGLDWICWNWTNPSNTDFNSTIVFFDGVNVVNATQNYYNATGLSCGSSHNITLWTKDNSGNVNSTSIFNLSSTLDCLDSTPPIISILDPVNGSTLSASTTSAAVRISTNENATCRYSLSNQSFSFDFGQNFTSSNFTEHSFTYSGLSSGAYRIYYKCKDLSSNINSQSIIHVFSIASSPSGGSPGGSGGGGGGGGGSSSSNATNASDSGSGSSECTTNWSCTSWSQCSYGLKSRNCSKSLPQCANITEMPSLSEECSSSASAGSAGRLNLLLPAPTFLGMSWPFWILLLALLMALIFLFFFLIARRKKDYEAILKRLIKKTDELILRNEMDNARKLYPRIQEAYEKIPEDRKKVYHPIIVGIHGRLWP